MSDSDRRKVLGIEGADAWKEGGNWQKYMRNWKGLAEPDTRLKNLMEKNLVPPTDEFIKTLADRQKVPYTIGKKGNDRFYGDDGRPIYPPNDGAVGIVKIITLRKGETLLDRYGDNEGRFISPYNTPYIKRSLPETNNREKEEYHIYKIAKNIKNVSQGIVAPWFGKPGGGIQYKLPRKICDLGDYLKEIEQNDIRISKKNTD